MTKKKTDVVDGLAIALYLPKAFRPDFSGMGTQAFELDFVTVNDREQVRNCSNSYSDDTQAMFADLSFRCQASPDMNDGKPYAYDLCYRHVHTVDTGRCERMLKTLRRIDKAGEKFPVRPETFGQFVAMHCRALGVMKVARCTGDNGWHNESSHQFWLANDIQWLVDGQVNEFLTANRDAMVQARAGR
jgi:hypothetical protein